MERGKTTVLKFGGSSLEDTCAFERAAGIVCSCENKSRVVVVSAMSGMTDALLGSARTAAEGNLKQAILLLESQLTRHRAIAQNLLRASPWRALSFINTSGAEIESLLYQLYDVGDLSPRAQDQIVSYGEQLSAKLMTLILVQHGQQADYVDARHCILTNEEYGAAKVLLEECTKRTRTALLPLLNSQTIPVLGGFFGLSTSGITTTLGRGSSDYTATLISAALHARETQIWTDVDGVMSADPQLIKTARLIPRLSYDEAAELARFGGKVLHPKTIEPVAKIGIPLRVCNSRNPANPGTVVSARLPGAKQRGLKAIAHKSGVTMIDFASSRVFMSNGFRTAVERIFHEQNATVDIVHKDVAAARLICEPTDSMPAIVENLEKLGTVRVENDLSVICCVGASARELETLLFKTDPGIRWLDVSSVSSIAFAPAQTAAQLIALLHEQM